MYRPIKFRGRRKDTGRWIYGSLICDAPEHPELSDGYRIVAIDDTYPYEWYVVDPKTIGQFTGLYDRSGEEIYEGQPVNYSHSWDYEGGHEDKHRVFCKDKKNKKSYRTGIVEWEQGEYAHFVINPGRFNLGNSIMLVEIIHSTDQIVKPDPHRRHKNPGAI